MKWCESEQKNDDKIEILGSSEWSLKFCKGFQYFCPYLPQWPTISPKETNLLIKKYQHTNHQWFYATNSISGGCLMLFWTKKFRIYNKQIYSNLAPILIHKVRSPINHTQHLDQCLGNQKTPIGYGCLEAEDKLKIVDNNFTISTSQHKTEQTWEQFFLACL